MDEDLDDLPPELGAVFDRLRARYENPGAPSVEPALSAFMTAQTTASGRRPVLTVIAAFLGTTLGKIVLGTTIAAASVGAGQATGVIDVTPDPDPAPVVTTTDDNADEQGDNADDQGEDADDQGDNADDNADEQGDNADDQADNADDNADEQGDNADDNADDQRGNADDRRDNADDKADDRSDNAVTEDD